jgi:hypothetical protein
VKSLRCRDHVAVLFTRSAQYGLSLELPPAAQPPDGAVIRNMLMMWSRVVKPR